jgi:hypothetical protein
MTSSSSPSPPPPPVVLSYPKLLLPWLFLGSAVIFVLWALIEDHSPMGIFVVVFPIEIVLAVYWIILYHQVPILLEWQQHGVVVQGTICYEAHGSGGLSTMEDDSILMKQRIQYQANDETGGMYLVTKDVGWISRQDVLVQQQQQHYDEGVSSSSQEPSARRNTSNGDDTVGNPDDNEPPTLTTTAPVLVMAGYPKSGILQHHLNQDLIQTSQRKRTASQWAALGLAVSLVFLSLWCEDAYFEDETVPNNSSTSPSNDDATREDVKVFWSAVLVQCTMAFLVGLVVTMVLQHNREYKLQGGSNRIHVVLHWIATRRLDWNTVAMVPLAKDDIITVEQGSGGSSSSSNNNHSTIESKEDDEDNHDNTVTCGRRTTISKKSNSKLPRIV